MGQRRWVSDEFIEGFPACMQIATPDGWLPAGEVRTGDAVWCLDAPPQPVVAIRSQMQRRSGGVLLPQGALGNPRQLILPPDQPVALDLDQAALFYGDPVVLLPARALLGWRGIRRCSQSAQVLVRLRFARQQVIYAGPGLLLGCSGVVTQGLRLDGPPAVPLTAQQAKHLMTCVMAEEVGASLRPNL